MSSKDNIDNNCLHEIKQQLAHLTGMFEQFLSGVKGPDAADPGRIQVGSAQPGPVAPGRDLHGYYRSDG